MTRSLMIRAFSLFPLGSMFVADSSAGQGVPRLDSYNGVAVRILQSNNAGNIHHIIDPVTNRVTGPHQRLSEPAQSDHSPRWPFYYCSNEAEDTVDVFDRGRWSS